MSIYSAVLIHCDIATGEKILGIMLDPNFVSFPLQTYKALAIFVCVEELFFFLLNLMI